MMSENSGRQTVSIMDVLRNVPFYFGFATSGVCLLALIQYLALPSTPGWHSEVQIPSVRLADFSATDGKVFVRYLSRPNHGGKSLQSCVAVFGLDSSEWVWHLPIANPICFKLSPAEDIIAVADMGGYVYLMDADRSEKTPGRLGPLPSFVLEMFWSHDGSRLLTRSLESVLVWSVLDGKLLVEIPVNGAAEVHVPNRTDNVVIGCNGLARVYDLRSGVFVQSYPLPSNARSILVSSDLNFLFCIAENNILMQASKESSSLLETQCKVAAFTKSPMAISPDQKHFAMIEHSEGSQFICQIREISTLSVIFSQTIDCESVGGIQFTNSQTLWIWNYGGSAVKYEFDDIRSLAFGETPLRMTQKWACPDSRRPSR